MDSNRKKYYFLNKPHNSPSLVKEGSKYGFISNKGNIRIPIVYDWATPFSDGLAAVCKDGIYYYINKDGNTAIPLEFEDAKPFSEGIAAVKRYGNWGYINKKGKTLVEYRYDEAHEFSEGMASVCLNGVYIFINEWEDILQPYTYPWAGSFINGVALIRNKEGYYLINRGGVTVSEVMKEYEVEDYLREYPLYKPDLREFYDNIINTRNINKLKSSSETVVLINKAKKHTGKILEVGISLEKALGNKMKAIERKRYQEAAKYRERENILVSQLKLLLKEKKEKG